MVISDLEKGAPHDSSPVGRCEIMIADLPTVARLALQTAHKRLLIQQAPSKTGFLRLIPTQIIGSHYWIPECSGQL